ncbi:Protein of unknown function [Paraburkholderia lycopersici]|uniref:DUF3540 domain-containing protein n=1 Tax=Paraburkholderia lycopersici TaxID=416944 RepID=A0A1G6XT85_9BURK|nr:Protein of unknown function [Paraburkholderia lycopersici]
MHSVHPSFIPLTRTPFQQDGRLINRLPDGSFMVESRGQRWHCRRAASCLLDPQCDDTVLIAGNDDGQVWLLAVLERVRPDAIAEVTLPDGLRISTPRGSLHLASRDQVHIGSKDFSLEAEDAQCRLRKLDFDAAEVSSWIGIGRWIGCRSESLWDSVTQISRHLFRHVRQTEHVRAAQMDYQAEGLLRLHARNTIATSDAITKIDSEQIHVG